MTLFIASIMIIAGVALYVAAPLTGGLLPRGKKSGGNLERQHWEHEQALAVQGLRELEFDLEMGKLSQTDYSALRAALEARALRAMAAIEKIRDQERAANLAEVSRPAPREVPIMAALAHPARPRRHPLSRPEPREAPAIGAISADGPLSAAEARPGPTTLTGAQVGAALKWPPADSVPMRRAKFCPQCGVRTPAAANFCAECGEQLRRERAATSPAS